MIQSIEPLLHLPPQLVGLGDGDRLEADNVAGAALADDGQVGGDDGGDLGVAAHGLAFGQHDDGQTRGGHLDGTGDHARRR